MNSIKPKNDKEIVDENQFKSGYNLQDLIQKNYLVIKNLFNLINNKYDVYFFWLVH